MIAKYVQLCCSHCIFNIGAIVGKRNCRKLEKKRGERHSKYKYRRVFIDYQSERVTKKALGLLDPMML